MTIHAKSTFALNLVWHARYSEGEKLAGWLHDHFGADRFRNVTAGARVQISYPVLPSEGVDPTPVDWERADTTAVVVFLNQDLVQDPQAVSYLKELGRSAEPRWPAAGVFPVLIDGSLPEGGLGVQGIRWDKWHLEYDVRRERLVRDLAQAFIGMLRQRLSKSSATENQDQQDDSLQKIKVFLSHSKHDKDGAVIANRIRDWIHEHTALASFIDTVDIPPGFSFEEVIPYSIRNSILLAIRTDTYSAREWCCREVLQAKQNCVPMIVVDCLRSQEDRAFPYLGNVPTIRMTPCNKGSIASVIGCLLDEALLHYLWLCRTELPRSFNPEMLFLPRAPELASLSIPRLQDNRGGTSIVYPDPPMMEDEVKLFGAVRGDVTLHSFSEWEGGHPS